MWPRSPTIRLQQAGGPGKPVLYFQSESTGPENRVDEGGWWYKSSSGSESLRTRSTDVQQLRVGEDGCLIPSRESEFALPPGFCSIQAFHRLDGAHPPWGGQSARLSSPIQKLLSSGNTSQMHPEVFYQVSEQPLTQSS